MPNSPSAIKRLKQSIKAGCTTGSPRRSSRRYTKRTLAAVAAKEFEKAEADFRPTTAQDRQGGRPPGPAPEHRRPSQEQARSRLPRALAKAKAKA